MKELPSVAFRREREATWVELEHLIKISDDKGLRTLAADQLARLPHLYRATLSSLSVARAISLDRALVEYLESLVGRAYFVVYGTRQHVRRRLAAFFGWRWPSAVRELRWHILIATMITIAGALAAYTLTHSDADYYYSFVGDMAQGRTPAASTAELRDTLYHTESAGSLLATFAATLFSHNARIAIFAFALGFVAGLPTLALLFYNGLVLGAFVALFTSRGLGLDVWAWLLPHGVTELSAIVLCGAAGLSLAQGLVFAGARPRLDAMRDRGRTAATVVVGGVIMLFVAGLLEGVMRQVVTDMTVRYAIAAVTAVWWIWYFGWCGRAHVAELSNE
jgi:uncharacterized membrane protein SpoIIM required for sporulation